MASEALKILGTYAIEERQQNLSIDDSENISSVQISNICDEISSKNIDNLTLEFDADSFIYFNNFGNKIRFLEGKKTDYARLKQLVNSDLDGTIFRNSNQKSTESKTDSDSNVVTEMATPNSSSDIENESIHIHNTLFQSLTHFKKAYSEADLFFQPFEAPGGDFFWIKDYQYKSLAVVGDCTGHGMQGAMIAMSAMTLLKQFFKLPPTNIKESIYEYHEQFKSLMEEEQSGQFDVELGVILLDKRTNEISYMGSGINMILKNADAVTAYTTRKAKLISKKQESYSMKVEAGDQLFILSDGITDQFDADDNKKLGTKGIIKMIEDMPDPVTKIDFIESLNRFRGSTKQMDDQTMLMLTI